mgnify:FL=1
MLQKRGAVKLNKFDDLAPVITDPNTGLNLMDTQRTDNSLMTKEEEYKFKGNK